MQRTALIQLLLEGISLKDNASAFHSTEYDDRIKRTLPYYEEFYQQVIDVVNLYFPNVLNWLDVGCGTGKMAEAAFRQSKIGQFVFCDSSVQMIEIVKERFNFPNTEFKIASVQELEWKDRFDVITAIQVNHYLLKEEREKALRNCYEALKKGGLFICFENFAPSSAAGEELYLGRWKAWQQRQGTERSICEQHIARYGKDYFPISIEEQRELFNRCGFQASEILWLSYMQAGYLGIK